jgi:hypothetical protein
MQVKLKTGINGNLTPGGGNFSTSRQEFPVALNRTENSRNTLTRDDRDRIVKNWKYGSEIIMTLLIEIGKTQSVVMNMTDCAGLQYDWRLRLSRLKMTDIDLANYERRRRECGGGSDDQNNALI